MGISLNLYFSSPILVTQRAKHSWESKTSFLFFTFTEFTGESSVSSWGLDLVSKCHLLNSDSWERVDANEKTACLNSASCWACPVPSASMMIVVYTVLREQQLVLIQNGQDDIKQHSLQGSTCSQLSPPTHLSTVFRNRLPCIIISRLVAVFRISAGEGSVKSGGNKNSQVPSASACVPWVCEGGSS